MDMISVDFAGDVGWKKGKGIEDMGKGVMIKDDHEISAEWKGESEQEGVKDSEKVSLFNEIQVLVE